MISFLRQNARFLGAGVLLTFSSSYGQTYFISVFAGRIQGEFGLSHGGWGAVYMLATTMSALVMVWAGGLTDRYRARVLGPVALIGLAAAALAMAMIDSLWLLIPTVFALRFFGQGLMSHLAVVSMARWYVKQRGKALSIAGLGYAIGEAALPLIIVAFLTVYDWRLMWIGAAVAALIMVPVVWRMLSQERTPEAMATQDDAAGMGGVHWTRAQAIRHPLLWLTLPIVAGTGAFLTAFFFHQVHVAEVKGWTHAQLVALFPFYTLAGIVTMMGAGWALDKLGTGRLLYLSTFVAALSFLVFAGAQSLGVALLAAVLLGAFHGWAITVLGAFWAEYYGTQNLGGIRSLTVAVGVFGSAVGPGLTGALIDLGYDFPDQAPFIAMYFLLSGLCVWMGLRTASRSSAAAS